MRYVMTMAALLLAGCQQHNFDNRQEAAAVEATVASWYGKMGMKPPLEVVCSSIIASFPYSGAECRITRPDGEHLYMRCFRDGRCEEPGL